MKQLILFIGFIVTVFKGFSQEEEPDIYYPANTLYKKLKVKSSLDTIASPPRHHFKKEYDISGRQIAWYYVEDSVITRFKYKENGDTLFKYHYYTKNGVDHDVYQYELFIYNSAGKILTYQNCTSSYQYNAQTSECSMDKFYYDEKNNLISKLIYSNDNYPHSFSVILRLTDTLLNLNEAYSYYYNKPGNLILKKSMTGKADYRATDSFFYDKKSRFIKIIRRQKRGFLGEFGVNDLCRTEIITYEANKKTITTFTTYSDWIEKTKSTMEINEYLFYPNGLRQAWLHKIGNSPKSMLDYSVYEFY